MNRWPPQGGATNSDFYTTPRDTTKTPTDVKVVGLKPDPQPGASWVGLQSDGFRGLRSEGRRAGARPTSASPVGRTSVRRVSRDVRGRSSGRSPTHSRESRGSDFSPTGCPVAQAPGSNKKAQPWSAGLFVAWVPDDDLLSRAAAHYHRRAAVSRSCSGWEGVVPAGYGRQALTGHRGQVTGNSYSGVSGGRASSADIGFPLLPVT